MVCFLRASTLRYDVRLQKYVQACIDENISYLVISWDRLNDSNVSPNEIQFKKKTPYGRRWRNLWAHITWQCFLLKVLLVRHKQYKVIHACNIETVLPALFMKLFGKKIVFDIYDSCLIKIERQVAKIVDLLILPNKKRFAQISVQEADVRAFLEIENVPTIKYTSFKHEIKDAPVRLSYVGVFEKDVRGLEGLIREVLDNDNIELTIAGTGAGLETMVNEAANICQRINYLGVVNYAKALEVMSESDFIVAQYYLVNPLHKFASPNKYYESLCLGTPVITTVKTLVGDMAAENNVGYAIGEAKDDLHKFLSTVQTDGFKKDYIEKSTNCLRLWDEQYADYYNLKLRQAYIDHIRQLSLR